MRISVDPIAIGATTEADLCLVHALQAVSDLAATSSADEYKSLLRDLQLQYHSSPLVYSAIVSALANPGIEQYLDSHTRPPMGYIERTATPGIRRLCANQ